MVGGSSDEGQDADAGFAVHILSPDGETLHSLDEILTKSPLRPSEHPARWTLRFTCSRCKDNIT